MANSSMFSALYSPTRELRQKKKFLEMERKEEQKKKKEEERMKNDELKLGELMAFG